MAHDFALGETVSAAAETASFPWPEFSIIECFHLRHCKPSTSILLNLHQQLMLDRQESAVEPLRFFGRRKTLNYALVRPTKSIPVVQCERSRLGCVDYHRHFHKRYVVAV
jgi:hypothetical protein